MLFTDHLESTNHALRTIRTRDIAVPQLGSYLREQDLPTDPRKVRREHLSAWMPHLQRSPEDGGRGLSAQTALQRFQSVRQFFKFLEEAGGVSHAPPEATESAGEARARHLGGGPEAAL